MDKIRDYWYHKGNETPVGILEQKQKGMAWIPVKKYSKWTISIRNHNGWEISQQVHGNYIKLEYWEIYRLLYSFPSTQIVDGPSSRQTAALFLSLEHLITVLIDKV